MQTRIVYTSFWVNSVQEDMSLEAQHLYIYFITCPHIGICSVFRLPDKYILLESGLNEQQLKKAKQELTEKKKAYFYNGWINLVSAEKFVNYKSSPQNARKYLKEVSFIPKEILTKLSYKIDTTIDTTMDTNDKYRIINNKRKKDRKYKIEAGVAKVIE